MRFIKFKLCYELYATFQNKSKLITRRMFILSTLKVAVFLANYYLDCFICKFQKILNIDLCLIKNRFKRMENSVPERGIIQDFFGEKIAEAIQRSFNCT